MLCSFSGILPLINIMIMSVLSVLAMPGVFDVVVDRIKFAC